MTEQEKHELKELSTVLSVINNGVEYRTFDMTKLTSWIEAQEKKKVEEERERIIAFATKELEWVIDTKTTEFPPRYVAGLRKTISQREQLLMCQEVAWRGVLASLTHLEDTK